MKHAIVTDLIRPWKKMPLVLGYFAVVWFVGAIALTGLHLLFPPSEPVRTPATGPATLSPIPAESRAPGAPRENATPQIDIINPPGPISSLVKSLRACSQHRQAVTNLALPGPEHVPLPECYHSLAELDCSINAIIASATMLEHDYSGIAAAGYIDFKTADEVCRIDTKVVKGHIEQSENLDVLVDEMKSTFGAESSCLGQLTVTLNSMVLGVENTTLRKSIVDSLKGVVQRAGDKERVVLALLQRIKTSQDAMHAVAFIRETVCLDSTAIGEVRTPPQAVSTVAGDMDHGDQYFKVLAKQVDQILKYNEASKQRLDNDFKNLNETTSNVTGAEAFLDDRIEILNSLRERIRPGGPLMKLFDDIQGVLRKRAQHALSSEDAARQPLDRQLNWRADQINALQGQFRDTYDNLSREVISLESQKTILEELFLIGNAKYFIDDATTSLGEYDNINNKIRELGKDVIDEIAPFLPSK